MGSESRRPARGQNARRTMSMGSPLPSRVQQHLRAFAAMGAVLAATIGLLFWPTGLSAQAAPATATSAALLAVGPLVGRGSTRHPLAVAAG